MKIMRFVLITVAAVLGSSANMHATTAPSAPVFFHGAVSQNGLQMMGFRDRPEADMLRRAYHILATGDHDYKGHRAAAMRAVRKAGDLLGIDLAGDDKDHEKQLLSDDRMREARDLLHHVLDAAEVKDEKKISKHIEAAIGEIDHALRVR